MLNNKLKNDKKKYDLEERTAKFGEAIIKFAKKIPKNSITTVRNATRRCSKINFKFMELRKNKKLIIGIAIFIVLASIGIVGALNGWWGGGGPIPEDTFTRGLVGHWSFDEGGGFIAYDQSENGNNGTIRGTNWLSGWNKRVRITIDYNDINSNLSNFPVLIYLSDSSGPNNDDVSFVFDELQSDGNSMKIAVTKSDGTTELYVEIEEWDDASETAWLWVSKSDWTISSSEDTDLYLYYDVDHADNTDYVGDDPNDAASQAVWDSNFMMVHHLTGASAAALDDSTSNNNEVDGSGGSPEYDSTGEIAKAIGLEKSIPEFVYVGDADTLDLSSTASWEFWFNAESIPADLSGVWDVIMNKYDTSGDQRAWVAALYGGTLSQFRFLMSVNGTGYITNFYNWEPTLSEWYHITVTWTSGAAPTLYINSTPTAWSTSNTVTGTLFPSTRRLDIGNSYAGGRTWDGLLDEIRISDNVARNSSWVKASYETQRDHLLDWGSEEIDSDYIITAWTTGKIDSALDFDGVNDYVLVPHQDLLSLSSMSIEVWFKFNEVGDMRIISKRADSDYYANYQLSTYGASLIFEFGNGASSEFNLNGPVPTAGAWYHVIVSYDDSTRNATMYVNGSYYDDDIASFSPNQNTGDLYIGARDGGTKLFNGTIDEVRIYNRALSAEEVRFHYSRGRPVGYWKFDEGSGQKAYDSTWNNNDRWLDDWNYRKSHVIESTNNSGANYQMKIIAHYATDTDSGEDVYLNGHSRTDFGDVRFTDNDGITELDYWQESYTASSTSTFWVEVADDFSNSNTKIYIYYGNSSTTTTSNGDNTFLFFDDFPGGSLDPQWDDTAGSPTVGNGYIRMYSGDRIRDTTPSWLYNVRSHIRVRNQVNDQSSGRWGLSNAAVASDFYADSCAYENFTTTNVNTVVRNNGGSLGQSGVTSGYSPYTWYIGQIKWKSGSIEFLFGSDDTTQTSYIPAESLNPRLEGNLVSYYVDFDWIFVGKWVDPEPTHSIWTEEEEEASRKTGWLGGSSTVEASDPTWVEGKFGTALNFDGDDDYVDGRNDSSLAITNGTIEAWINGDSWAHANGNNYPKIVAKETGTGGAGGYGLCYSNGDDKLRFVTNNVGYNSNSSLSLSTWYYVAVTIDGTNLRMYINGALDATHSLANLPTSTANLYIGNSPAGTRYFDGMIDEVRIYNYARTQDEIRLDYNAGFAARFGPHSDCDEDPGACMTNGLVGYWAMDEGAGTTAEDASEEGNDGTLNGNSAWTTGKVGGALSFDGDNDYVVSGDSEDIDLVNNFTISAWIKSSVLNDTHHRIVHKDGAYTFWITNVNSSLGGYYYQEGGGGTYYNSNINVLTVDQWYHVVQVKSSVDGFSIYVNGKDEGGNAGLTGNTRESDVNIYIGIDEDETTYEFYGKIDEVRIYNRVLSATEIRYHYNRGGPVGYWKFDEGSGTLVGDTTDNMNNAIIHGPALSFDGTDDRINIPHSSSLEIEEEVTLEAWVYRDVYDAYHTIFGSDWAYPWLVRIEGDTGNPEPVMLRFRFYDTTDTGELEAYGLLADRWSHITVTFDKTPGEIKLYINGILIDTWQSASYQKNLIIDNGKEFFIGSTNNSVNYFNGTVDEVRIYNRALSADEVKQHSRGLFRDETGLVMYLPFNEGSGDTAVDRSSEGNDGNLGADDNCPNYTGENNCPTWTLREGPIWATGKFANALNFDGNDFLEVFESDGLDFTGEFSVSTWFKLDNNTTNNQTIFSKGGSTTTTYWADIRGPGDSIIFGGYNSGAGTAYTMYVGEEFAVDRWYHMAGTYDKLKLRIYLDGELVHSASETDDWVNNNDSLVFGSRALTYNRFYGSIDETRIYNYVRSDEEIRIDYNAGFAARFGPHSDCDEDPGACMTNGLVGYWAMDEGAGTTAEDASGEGNDGTLNGDPAWTTGKVGGALSFDGVDSFVDTADITIESTDLTLSAWIYLNDLSADEASIISKFGSSTAERAILLRVNTGGRLEFFTHNGSSQAQYQTAADTIILDKWYHVVLVYDDSANDAEVYANGVHQEWTYESGVLYEIQNTTTKLTIGRWSDGGDPLNGIIDDVRVYNRALTVEEVRFHYSRGGPVGYWKLNEGEGQTAYDYTDNNNDGTLGATGGSESSDPTWAEGKYGSALNFDGSNDYVDLASDITLSNTFSIEFWFNRSSSGVYRMIFGTNEGSGIKRKIGFSNSDTFFIRVLDGGSSDTSVVAPTTGWHHAAITRDSNNKVDLYLDGGAANRLFSDATQSGDYLIMYIGGYDPGGENQMFNGPIDEVRVYNYVRTPAQILQDYNAGFSIYFK